MKNHNFSPDNRPTRMINLVEDAMQMRADFVRCQSS
jgi:hypothetical protein